MAEVGKVIVNKNGTAPKTPGQHKTLTEKKLAFLKKRRERVLNNSVFSDRYNAKRLTRIDQRINDLSNNGANAMAITGATMNAVGMLVNDGLQIAKYIDQKKDKTTNNNTNGNSTVTSNTTTNNTTGNSAVASNNTVAELSGMMGAKDPATLRDAIETAENKLATLKSQQETAEGKEAELKTKSETAKKTINGLDKSISAKDKEIKDANSKVNSQKQVVSSFQDKYNSALFNQTQAGKAVTAAEQTVADLKSAWENTPDTIDDGNGNQIPNPAKATAKQQLDKADDNLKTAKEKKQLADKAVENAEKALETAKNKLKDLEKQVETLTKDKEELERKRDAAEQDITNYEKAIKTNKQRQKQIDGLETEIKKQQERLKKLEQEQQEQNKNLNGSINELGDKIAKRSSKIDESDGMSVHERTLQKANQRTFDKQQGLASQQNELQESISANANNLAADLGMTVGNAENKNGHTFQINSNGTFEINGQQVSSYEFKKAYNAKSESTPPPTA